MPTKQNTVKSPSRKRKSIMTKIGWVKPKVSTTSLLITLSNDVDTRIADNNVIMFREMEYNKNQIVNLMQSRFDAMTQESACTTNCDMNDKIEFKVNNAFMAMQGFMFKSKAHAVCVVGTVMLADVVFTSFVVLTYMRFFA